VKLFKPNYCTTNQATSLSVRLLCYYLSHYATSEATIPPVRPLYHQSDHYTTSQATIPPVRLLCHYSGHYATGQAILLPVRLLFPSQATYHQSGLYYFTHVFAENFANSLYVYMFICLYVYIVQVNSETVQHNTLHLLHCKGVMILKLIVITA